MNIAFANDARINPHARIRRAVVFNFADTVQKFARRKVVAVDFAHNVFNHMILRIIPRQQLNNLVFRFGRVGVKLANFFPEHVENQIIGLGVAERFGTFHAPLNHAH